MATRLVILKDGIIQQVGAPKEVYDNPENIFVGGVIGSPSMNFFTGKVVDGWFQVGEEVRLKVPEGKMKTLREQNYIEKEVILGMRPEESEEVHVCGESTPVTKKAATVDVVELMGSETYLYSKVNEPTFVARIDARTDITGGVRIELASDMNKVHCFDLGTE